ncbi:sugar-specific transcriptional regulator TrmB [Natranaerovirga pectinivora]|uniref:Sugar-specific transcriptional regulator TrmB n=1 Tax=Natranaerovirga pectinivora TaxID=682400 RepID=A0A4V6NZT4_9FIRM|nr:helix-turn-helix domain-containing protein [Natranaerovirga pectinivora]TCT14368.1 sugar-specific transcriptional regulator TrmB [Natranaerovirga pectinivora]
MDLLSAFKSIGFTKQETDIYLTLCEHGELSGYEAAKLSGISRSNTYASLSNLVEKGGAYVIEGQPTKYMATPIKELLQNSKTWFEKNIRFIEENVVYNNKPQQEAYVTIIGYDNIFNKLENMISLTNTHLYFSAEAKIINKFTNTLTKIAEDKKVVILSDEKILIPNIICYKTDVTSSLKLIVDTTTVLTGTLDQCLFSKNLTLVQLIREAMMNEIKLIQYEG